MSSYALFLTSLSIFIVFFLIYLIIVFAGDRFRAPAYKRHCPICHGKLLKGAYFGRKDVLKCARCNAFYVDNGSALETVYGYPLNLSPTEVDELFQQFTKEDE